MNLPNEIWSIIEEKVNKKNPKNLADNFRNISDRYMAKKVGEPLIKSSEEALAYCISRMPATFCAMTEALKHSIEMLNISNDSFESMLDVGSGTASATLAVLKSFNIKNIKCIERENYMSNIAKDFFTSNDISWYSEDVTKISTEDFKSDLVVSAYMVNELAENDLLRTVDFLWNNTKKMLLIVDPGTPDDYARMMAVRKHLIGKGAQIIAPCLTNMPCKLDKDDWCAFTTRVERNKLQKLVKDADAPYEDEKYTYLAFVRDDSLVSDSINGSRIIREPQITQNYIDLKLCQNDGTITSKKVTKSDKELFKKVKKSNNGDLFF